MMNKKYLFSAVALTTAALTVAIRLFWFDANNESSADNSSVTNLTNHTALQIQSSTNSEHAGAFMSWLMPLSKEDKWSAALKGNSDPNAPSTWDQFHGITVPPTPANEEPLSLLGVDVNKNGLRDDLERVLAYTLGDQPKLYALGLRETRALEEVMRSNNRAAREAYLAAISCTESSDFNQESRDKIGEVVAYQLNTPLRENAYRALIVDWKDTQCTANNTPCLDLGKPMPCPQGSS